METRERVLVTGASKGIGRGMRGDVRGDRVRRVVHFKDDEAGARDVLARVEARGAQGAIVRADLSKWSEGERLVAESGAIDHVVINHGVWKEAAIDAMTEAQTTRRWMRTCAARSRLRAPRRVA